MSELPQNTEKSLQVGFYYYQANDPKRFRLAAHNFDRVTLLMRPLTMPMDGFSPEELAAVDLHEAKSEQGSKGKRFGR